ncbi:MAG: response regulator [Bacteroidota bacterium]
MNTQSTPHTVTKKTSRISILLVEDDPVTAMMVKKVLDNQYMMHHATYGKEAIKLLHKYEFDLVLMDIDLDDVRGEEYLDGFDVLIYIREHPQLDALKVVAITSNMRQALRETYLAAGFNEYTQKPVTPQQVLSLVETVLAA